MGFLTLIRAGFSWVLKAAKWLLGMADKTTRMPRWVYYVAHYGLVILLTCLLGWFTPWILGPANLPPIPIVQQYWAGILLLLGYIFLRLLVHFISLFWEEDQSEFEDIERAFAAGLAGLGRAGLEIRRLPLFIVQGLEDAEVPHFFLGANFSAKVVAPSPEERSPLRFYANQDALFIVCSNVSAIVLQLQNVIAGMPGAATRDVPLDQATETLRPEGIRQAVAAGPVDQTLTPGARQRLVQEAGPAARETSSTLRALNRGELQRCERRTRRLCQLLEESRKPLCPLNGLLLVVPMDWTREGTNQALYHSIELDVRVLHEGTRQMFPVVCLFNGLQTLGSVQEFVDRVKRTDPSFNTNARAGAHFPPGHPVDEPAARWVLEKGLEWFRGWTYQAFAHDLSHASNPQLYQLMCRLEDRRDGLLRVLHAAFSRRIFGECLRLSGCYFCAIDMRARKQAFIYGIVKKLVNEQELVAYPVERIRLDETARNWGYVMCLAIVILMVADIWLFLV